MTVKNEFVSVEQKIGLESQQLPSNVFVLVRIQNIVLSHHCKNGLDQVLESLVDDSLNSRVEFDGPLLLTEVVLEVLDDLACHQSLCLQDPLVDGIEVNQEHVEVEWTVH